MFICRSDLSAHTGYRMLLRQFAVAALYALLTTLAAQYFPPEGISSLIHPATGWGLAMMLIGGCRYGWGVFAGGLLSYSLLGSPPAAALGVALAQTLGQVAACQLLTRDPLFAPRLDTMQHYFRLLLKGILPLILVSSLLAMPWLAHAGLLPLELHPSDVLLWAMGESLGILLVTPLVLLWTQHPLRLDTKKRWLEAALMLGLTALAGQAIFLDAFPQAMTVATLKGYWLFPLLAWAAARLGRRVVLLGLVLLAVQAMLGVQQNSGFFTHPDLMTRLIDGWSFMVVTCVLSIFLATTLREMRQASNELRIAATAFECQEGMVVTDADGHILRVNQSSTRIMGYRESEVLGQSVTFVRSDRHPQDFYDQAWRTTHERGFWAGEVWHRRRNGEVFPQWVSMTAVRNGAGITTNVIFAHTDISQRKEMEAALQQQQAQQRDALVREVHHRIKNNLQGITGLLRQFAEAHPETAEPLNQAIGQVRSIAVIHGLQGRSSERTVRLCELTREVARDIATLWQAPVRVDIPSEWTPCIVTETEAVPLALVLNELILNAVKHGNRHAIGASVSLRKGEQADHIRLCISNAGVWHMLKGTGRNPVRSGLQLVDAMLPRSGAQLKRQEDDGMIHVWLMLAPPVITLETPPTRPHASDTPALPETVAG